MGCSEVIIPAQSIRSSGVSRACNNLSGFGNSVSDIYIRRSEIHQPSMPTGDEGKNRAEIYIFWHFLRIFVAAGSQVVSPVLL